VSPCAFPRKCPWLVQAFCELALSFTVGWQVRAEDSSQGAYMRFYYCDFLDSKEHRNACERLRNAWRDNQKDAKRLFEWVCSLKPRSKMEAYPMFVIVQEMLKEVLDNKLEMHLEMLNEARERIDLLDGDHSELRDQCGRIEEDLARSNEQINQLLSKIDEGLAREDQLQNEIRVLQEELKVHSEEIGQREDEKNRMHKMYERAQNNLEFERLVNAVTRSRANIIEADMALRVQDLCNWKQHAEHAAKALDQGAHFSSEDLKQHSDARAVQAGLECLHYLETELQASQYRRAMDLDGVFPVISDPHADMQSAEAATCYCAECQPTCQLNVSAHTNLNVVDTPRTIALGVIGMIFSVGQAWECWTTNYKHICSVVVSSPPTCFKHQMYIPRK
jgi:hypothetical protein